MPLVEIRTGPTSTGDTLFATVDLEEVLDREFTSKQGLYVRFRGRYPESEHLAFVYTPYRQLDVKSEKVGKGIWLIY